MVSKEITKKIDQFLATLPSDSLGACREQWATFVWTYAQNYHIQQQKIERIAVKTTEGIELILTANILYLQSDKGYTTFFLEGGEKILVSKVLKTYEELLPPHCLYVVTNPIWLIAIISKNILKRVS